MRSFCQLQANNEADIMKKKKVILNLRSELKDSCTTCTPNLSGTCIDRYQETLKRGKKSDYYMIKLSVKLFTHSDAMLTGTQNG